MDAVVDFLIRPRIDRRLYWTSLPVLAVIGLGGYLLFRWSQALGDVVARRVSGITIVVAAIALALWIVGRRMKDTGGLMLWVLGISLGGRLAEAAARLAGGSHGQPEAALGLVFVLVLLGLGLAPSQRAPVADEGEDDEADAEEAAASP